MQDGWIKADGCDLKKGLCESTRGVWSGDVRLDDGRLQQLYRDYQDKLDFIKAVGVDSRAPLQVLRPDLE